MGGAWKANGLEPRGRVLAGVLGGGRRRVRAGAGRRGKVPSLVAGVGAVGRVRYGGLSRVERAGNAAA
nr:unnamed protein product [Digitaria exilis]